ncbi:MAG: response regulator transcription factor [Campylobacterota bacterium]|nr:response regulator transcription factor [Campylobacterota bacterium]
MKAQILIVEDDSDLIELLEYRLTQEGYETMGFLSTTNVKRALNEEKVDLILMDRNLPGIEGSDFIAMMREKGMDIPVIYLSAKNSQNNIEDGFRSGGDDYVTKPFEMTELLLRIEAILRRSKVNMLSSEIQYRDILLNLNTRIITIEAKEVELTKLEFDLIYNFIIYQDRVLDREFLLKHVWKTNENYQGRTVNVAINRLKEKIDPDKNKNYIKTIRGVGYTIQQGA